MIKEQNRINLSVWLRNLTKLEKKNGINLLLFQPTFYSTFLPRPIRQNLRMEDVIVANPGGRELKPCKVPKWV